MSQAEQIREVVVKALDEIALGLRMRAKVQGNGIQGQRGLVAQAGAVESARDAVRVLPLPPASGGVEPSQIREAAAALADEEARRLRNGGAINALRRVAAAIRALPLPPPEIAPSRAESLSSDEVWAIRELIAVSRKPLAHPNDDLPNDEDRKAFFLIHKCEKNGVAVERCRRLLDILDLDTDLTVERLARYRRAG